MALHLRDQIMAGLVSALTGLTTTGSRVYADRDAETNPLAASELPGLTIMQRPAGSAPITLAFPRTMQADADIDITAFVKSDTGPNARLQANLIAKEIAAAIGAQPLVASLGCTLTPSEDDPTWDSGSELPAARLDLRYRARYFFKEATPDVAN